MGSAGATRPAAGPVPTQREDRHYDVDVVAYFGVSQPDRGAARCRPAPARRARDPAPRAGRCSAAARTRSDAAVCVAVIDHTYMCDTTFLGGLYELKNRAHAGIRAGSGWSKLPYVVAGSGGWAAPVTGLSSAPSYSLAWITAGVPTEATTVGGNGEVFSVRGGGTIGVNASRVPPDVREGGAERRGACAAAKCRSPGSRSTASCLGVSSSGSARRSTASTALRERARIFVATNAPAREAKLAVRTPAGKPLNYAQVDQTGAARLFTAKGCMHGVRRVSRWMRRRRALCARSRGRATALGSAGRPGGDPPRRSDAHVPGGLRGRRATRRCSRHGRRRGTATTLDWLAQATVSTPGNPLSKQNTQPHSQA